MNSYFISYLFSWPRILLFCPLFSFSRKSKMCIYFYQLRKNGKYVCYDKKLLFLFYKACCYSDIRCTAWANRRCIFWISYCIYSIVLLSISFFYFPYLYKKFYKKVRLPVLMNLYVLTGSEHDLMFFQKMPVCQSLCLSLYESVCNKDFLITQSKELVHDISWSCIFCLTLI